MNVGVLEALLKLRDELSPALKVASKNLEKTGADLRSFGHDLLPVSAALAAAGGASLFMAAKFEASIAKMVGLAGVARGEMTGVKEHVLALATASGIGPQKLAEAMMLISSTTSDTKVALSILDVAARASAAGMGEAADVGKAITSIVNSYGAENITAARAADILTQAVKDGGAEATELAPVLANVIPVAAQLGVSFEEVAANIATVTKLGVPAAEAVTQLASVFTAMLKETNEGAEALSKVGLSYDYLRHSIKEKGLQATLQELSTTFKGNETELTKVFGRIEALRNVMSSAGQQSETYAAEVKAMTGSVGALGKAHSEVEKTTSMTWAKLTAQVDVVAIRFGDVLAPSFAKAVDAAKPLLSALEAVIKWFGGLDPAVQTAVIAALAFVAVLGPLAIALGAAVSAVSALTGALGGALLPVLGTAAAAVGVFFLAFKGASWVIDAVPGLRSFAEAVGKIALELSLVQPFLDAHNAAVAKGVDATKTMTEEQKRALMVFTTHRDAVLALKAAHDGGAAATAGAAAAAGKHSQSLAQETAAAIKTAQEMKLKKEASDLLGRAVTSVAEATLVMAQADAAAQLALKGMTKEEEAEIARLEVISKGMEGAAEIARKELAEALGKVRQELSKDQALKKYMDDWKELNAAFRKSGLALSELNTVIDEGKGYWTRYGDVVEAELDAADDGIKKVSKSTTDWQGILEGMAMFADMLGGGFSDLPGILSFVGDAFERIGNEEDNAKKNAMILSAAISVVGMVGAALGKSATPAIAKLGGAISGAAAGAKLGTAIMPGWGTAVGAVVGAVFGLWSASKKLAAELKKLRGEFVDSMGGMEALDKAARAAGFTIDAMMKAKNKKDLLKAIDEIKNKLDTFKQANEDLNAAIEKYGFTVDELGPRFAAQKLDEQAASLLKDYSLLAAAGVEVNTIIEKMGPALMEYVNTAVKAGVDIPQNMKPIIDALYEQGRLLHEDGTAYTEAEYQALHYGKTLSESMQDAVEAINRLVAALTGIPIPAPIHIPVTYDDPGAPGGHRRGDDGEPTGYASGSGWEDHGTGKLAMLHGVERVQTPAQAAAAVASASGGGGGSSRDMARLDRRLAQLPAMMARAVRDGVLKAV